MPGFGTVGQEGRVLQEGALPEPLNTETPSPASTHNPPYRTSSASSDQGTFWFRLGVSSPLTIPVKGEKKPSGVSLASTTSHADSLPTGADGISQGKKPTPSPEIIVKV